MPRRSKGPRLYLRPGRPDPAGGRYPDIWVIRDGPLEIGTGCRADELSGPAGAESQLAAHIATKWAPRPSAEAEADDTGTRPGVIPKLLWEESPTQAWADLERATIWRRGKKEKDHKTKRRPMVKLPRRLLAHMRRWKANDMKLMAALAEAELPTTNAVIHHGGRALAGRIRRSFEAAIRDAGLNPDATPHWQRHTAATWLMQNGCDLYEAAGYLGMTVKTLEEHYAHHQPGHPIGALKAIGTKG